MVNENVQNPCISFSIQNAEDFCWHSILIHGTCIFYKNFSWKKKKKTLACITQVQTVKIKNNSWMQGNISKNKAWIMKIFFL